MSIEVDARLNAAADAAAYALLGELDTEVALAAVVALIERASRFRAIEAAERELARAR